MHEVLVNRLGGLSLPRKSVVRLTDMTLNVYRGRKTTIQQRQDWCISHACILFPELQIRRGVEDNSKIIFLISGWNICCDSSLELSEWDGSNGGYKICFCGEIWLIIPGLSLVPLSTVIVCNAHESEVEESDCHLSMAGPWTCWRPWRFLGV